MYNTSMFMFYGKGKTMQMQMWTNYQGMALGDSIRLAQDVDGKIKVSALNGVFAS